MSETELIQALRFYALSELKGFGPVRLRQLLEPLPLESFQLDREAFWQSCQSWLQQASALNSDAVALCCQRITQPLAVSWPERDRLLAWLQHDQHHLRILGQSNYPELLQQISDPPLILYLAGDAELLHQPQLAIVGARKPNMDGFNDARRFAGALAELGWVITSGLAQGIDAAAHQGCLQAGGKTIAVLGTGIDKVYPAANRALYEQILQQGLLISEFPLGTPPRGPNFPKRNRIVSGLSLGLLVVEAALKSGSLISARLANEQGREVFAIPGSIHQAQSKGCHQLIKQGAKLTETIEDIHEELQHWLQPEFTHKVVNDFLHDERSDQKSSEYDQIDLLTQNAPSQVLQSGKTEWFASSSESLSKSEALSKAKTKITAESFSNPDEYRLWQAIAKGAGSVDAMVFSTGLATGVIHQLLLTMELAGQINQQAGVYIVHA